MQVLIACARANIPIVPITIETVYENENAGTHFHPIRDSWRIYRVILGSFVKFMGASIASFLIDQGVFAVAEALLLPGAAAALAASRNRAIFLSTVIARCVSAPCNFLMNRSFVFRFKRSAKTAAVRYAALCVVIMLLSAAGVWLLSRLGMPRSLDNLSKLVIDTLLYFLSYRVQSKWVFKEKAP